MARWQLLEAGVSAQQIKVRLRTGRLHEIHRGIYLVGHAVPPPYARETAALLAHRHKAALSHRSATALWNLIPYPPPGDVCITIPPERSAARPGLKVHRAALHPRDIRQRHGLTLTSPPRTLLDLAASTPADYLEHLVAEAHYRHLATDAELRNQLERNPGKRGTARLRTILDLPGGPKRTRSPAERRMLALLRRAGVTGYETNARIHGYEVDLLWRERNLAVEIDGYDGHSGRVAFERDHLKLATLTSHGITVMPITGRQVRHDPRGVLQRLALALSSR